MIDEEYTVDTLKGVYKVKIEIEQEEDNEKAWTEVTTPCGNTTHLDITPYWPEKSLIVRMITFHSMFGYFVTREMVGIGGTVDAVSLEKVFEEAVVNRMQRKVYE